MILIVLVNNKSFSEPLEPVDTCPLLSNGTRQNGMTVISAILFDTHIICSFNVVFSNTSHFSQLPQCVWQKSSVAARML